MAVVPPPWGRADERRADESREEAGESWRDIPPTALRDTHRSIFRTLLCPLRFAVSEASRL